MTAEAADSQEGDGKVEALIAFVTEEAETVARREYGWKRPAENRWYDTPQDLGAADA